MEIKVDKAFLDTVFDQLLCAQKDNYVEYTQTILNKFEIILKENPIIASSNIRPLRDVVLVLPLDEVEMEGGLIIPESKREKPLKGRVLAVGPGKDGVAMTVKEGDMVLYARYGGIEAQSDGKACLLMRETDIFAID